MMYKDLLIRIKNIQERSQIISELKQESFNVFSILRKEYDEEKLHSAFLSELLNPKGSHGLGVKFVKLFIDEILHLNFDLDSSLQVFTEKKIEEGRTDIYIKNNQNKVIVIENKIYAIDQTRQLIRYSNHLENIDVHSLDLYYLTLDGIDADKVSTKDDKKDLISGIDYQTISYRADVIKWMELCQKEVSDYPILRETIKQYIILIKKLTGQLTDNLMDQEINYEIKKNYKAAKLIADNMWKVRESEVKDFIDELGVEIRTKLSNEWEIHIGNITEKWNGVIIRHQDWVEGVGVKLEGTNRITTNNSICGIFAHSTKFDRADLISRLSNIEILKTGFKESEYWPFNQSVVNFGKSPDIDKIFDANERIKLKENLANKMVQLSIECEEILKEVKKTGGKKV